MGRTTVSFFFLALWTIGERLPLFERDRVPGVAPDFTRGRPLPAGLTRARLLEEPPFERLSRRGVTAGEEAGRGTISTGSATGIGTEGQACNDKTTINKLIPRWIGSAQSILLRSNNLRASIFNEPISFGISPRRMSRICPASFGSKRMGPTPSTALLSEPTRSMPMTAARMATNQRTYGPRCRKTNRVPKPAINPRLVSAKKVESSSGKVTCPLEEQHDP